MCNCNKPKASSPARPRTLASGTGGKQSFSLLVGSNKTTYGSRLEADAANARSGFRGIVKPI